LPGGTDEIGHEQTGSRASADTHDRSHGAVKIDDDRAENGIALDSGSVATSEHQHTNGKRETIIDMRDTKGKVRLPAYLGDGLYLLSFGSRIPLSPDFHTKRAVYAPGYRAIRQDERGPFYLCEIVENRDSGKPEFLVSLLHEVTGRGTADITWVREERVALGHDPSHAWLRATNQDGQTVHLVSGAERFGLYEPTVVHHLQALPGADKAEGFVFRDFSIAGAGGDVESSPGVRDAFGAALESELKKRGATGLSDSWELPPEDMEIPTSWVEQYGGRKKRRRSGSYWG
jgi:hypothetical protein